jgi:ABC-type multidrug transport system ATPase subunit
VVIVAAQEVSRAHAQKTDCATGKGFPRLVSMGHVEVAHVSHRLPNGRVLLDDVSFRVGDSATAALVGPNGAGKTTLLRLVAGDFTPQQGSVSHSGGLGRPATSEN